MTATERLRELLDERGVEWFESITRKGLTWIRQDGKTVRFHPWQFNTLKVSMFDLTPEQAIEATLGAKITGETSDGYHTFSELYHHRAVLFSVIVRDHRELAWKSMKHHDGTMYEGMFIVGIDTPKGQATYHYDVDPYWDMFDCRELECAPEWDGHSPSDAIERIATLGQETCKVECFDDGVDEGLDGEWYSYSPPTWYLSCGHTCEGLEGPNFCPNCGREVVDG